MTTTNIAHPPIASHEEWLAARKELLAKEKEVTRARDALSAQRRRLPMVRIAKDYVFAGTNGPARLLDLFDGRRQLIIYHFMFDPRWDAGCPGCTGYVDALGDLRMLHERDTSFALVSRAPLAKLEAYRYGAVGTSRGSPRMRPTLITISTSPSMSPSPRSNTTSAARPSTSTGALLLP
jgi:predicted dithiol-disulfide oxidoreductase (DUF899 family)